jgi:OmcA/MtrC family decaheme c-type cytochrome
MCAACHTPNTVDSSGWAASSKVWIHAIHGSSKRTVPFTPTGASVTDNFALIKYPGVLKNCETCHLPGTYDFSASQYTAKDSSGKTIVDNMLYVTAAKGVPAANFKAPQTPTVTVAIGSGVYAYGATYGCGTSTSNSCSLVVGSTDFGVSPSWVTTAAATAGTVNPYTTEGNNRVSSPIAAACTSCHDDPATLGHVLTTGFGSFYAPRTTAIGVKEQCLFCHGPGKILPIKDAHNPNWDTTASPIKQPW